MGEGACRGRSWPNASPTDPIVGVEFADASIYCAWVGKRLPATEEWDRARRDGPNAGLEPLDGGPGAWLASGAPSGDPLESGIRCAADLARPTSGAAALGAQLGARFGRRVTPSERATRLYRAARAASEVGVHARGAHLLTALHSELSSAPLSSAEAALVMRWVAEARLAAGDRSAARSAYAVYLQHRRTLDSDATRNEVARGLDLADELPPAAEARLGSTTASPAPLRAERTQRERDWESYVESGRIYSGVLFVANLSFFLSYLVSIAVPGGAERFVPVAGPWISLGAQELDRGWQVGASVLGTLQTLAFATALTAGIGMASQTAPDPPPPRASIAPVPGGAVLSLSGSF